MPTVKAAEQGDRRDWERLWSENCAHFGADGMTATVVDELWCRLLDPRSPMQAWLAESAGEMVGLAHTILHPHTFSLQMLCYLEDLWVAPQARGAGVGTALIDHLANVAGQQGWRRLYWETGVENEAAQRLYDRIATRRPVRTYQIEFTDQSESKPQRPR